MVGLCREECRTRIDLLCFSYQIVQLAFKSIIYQRDFIQSVQDEIHNVSEEGTSSAIVNEESPPQPPPPPASSSKKSASDDGKGKKKKSAKKEKSKQWLASFLIFHSYLSTIYPNKIRFSCLLIRLSLFILYR